MKFPDFFRNFNPKIQYFNLVLSDFSAPGAGYSDGYSYGMPRLNFLRSSKFWEKVDIIKAVRMYRKSKKQRQKEKEKLVQKHTTWSLAAASDVLAKNGLQVPVLCHAMWPNGPRSRLQRPAESRVPTRVLRAPVPRAHSAGSPWQTAFARNREGLDVISPAGSVVCP